MNKTTAELHGKIGSQRKSTKAVCRRMFFLLPSFIFLLFVSLAMYAQVLGWIIITTLNAKITKSDIWFGYQKCLRHGKIVTARIVTDVKHTRSERVSEDTYNHICTVPTFAECIRAQTAHQIMAIKNRIRVLYVAYAANAIRNWVERVAEATTTKSQAAANIFEILPWCSFPVPSPCCSLQFHSFFAADTTVECVSSIFSSSPALIGDLANLLSAWVCLCTHPILCALDWIVRAYWTSFDACNRLLSVSSSSTTTSSSMAVVIVLIFQFFSGQEKGNVPIQA